MVLVERWVAATLWPTFSREAPFLLLAVIKHSHFYYNENLLGRSAKKRKLRLPSWNSYNSSIADWAICCSRNNHYAWPVGSMRKSLAIWRPRTYICRRSLERDCFFSQAVTRAIWVLLQFGAVEEKCRPSQTWTMDCKVSSWHWRSKVRIWRFINIVGICRVLLMDYIFCKNSKAEELMRSMER